MSIAVILNTHENSSVFKDTLDSIFYYLTDQVLVVVDGLSYKQFEKESLPCFVLSGLSHGKPSAPYRNVALGLMKAWETWGNSVGWYCYLEYDCLVGSDEVKNLLNEATLKGYWVLGNDLRKEDKNIEILNFLCRKKIDLYYFLGCGCFFNSVFIEKLSKDNFFEKFLNFTNFYTKELSLIDENNKLHSLYDISEFMYPSLAVSYGGEIKEIACWNETNSVWSGDFQNYPMRFRPDLTVQDPFQNACIMHPLKDFENPIRKYHREKRKNGH